MGVESQPARPGVPIDAEIDRLRRDRVPFVCILLDSPTPRPTVDVHVLRGASPACASVATRCGHCVLARAAPLAPLPLYPRAHHSLLPRYFPSTPAHRGLFLSEAVNMIEKEWNALHRPPPPVGRAPPAAMPQHSYNAPPHDAYNAPPHDAYNAPPHDAYNAPPHDAYNAPPARPDRFAPEAAYNGPPPHDARAPPPYGGRSMPDDGPRYFDHGQGHPPPPLRQVGRRGLACAVGAPERARGPACIAHCARCFLSAAVARARHACPFRPIARRTGSAARQLQ